MVRQSLYTVCNCIVSISKPEQKYVKTLKNISISAFGESGMEGQHLILNVTPSIVYQIISVVAYPWQPGGAASPCLTAAH